MRNLLGAESVDHYNFNALSGNGPGGATDGRLTSVLRQVAGAYVRLFGYIIHNPNATEAFIQIFGRPSSEVNLGVTAPDFIIKIGGLGSVAWDMIDPVDSTMIADGERRSWTGFSMAATTTDTGSITPTTGLTGSIRYK